MRQTKISVPRKKKRFAASATNPANRTMTGYFFSGREIASRIEVSAMMFFIL